MQRAATLAGLGTGVIILSVQFYLTMSSRLATGDNPLGAFIFFISFFTILTNSALIFIYISEISKARWLSGFRSDLVRGMMAGLMTLVMVFYHFMLAQTWDPQGWFKVCDIGLHYVTPILYLIWWAWVHRHGGLRFSHIPAMFIPPMIYVAYIMGRGAVAGVYPYPVFEAHKLGYAQVGINIAALLIFTAALFALVVVADKFLKAGTKSNYGT